MSTPTVYALAQKMCVGKSCPAPGTQKLTTNEEITILVIAILLAVLQIFIIKWLWNFIVPKVFGQGKYAEITFWDAFVLRLLAFMLIG